MDAVFNYHQLAVFGILARIFVIWLKEGAPSPYLLFGSTTGTKLDVLLWGILKVNP